MKRIITILAAMALAVSASAQVGIIGGVATPSNDIKQAYENFNAMDQYHIGITAKIPLFIGLAIQPSIIYDVKGATVANLVLGDVELGQAFSKTGYVEIPLQIQWGIDIADVVRPFVFAEPFVGYSVTMKKLDLTSLKVGELFNVSRKEDWQDVDLPFDKFDKTRLIYGCGIGAGVEVFKHFQLSARYVWNMGGLYDENGKSTFNLEESVNTMKNKDSNGIRISLAIMF